jgi:hypothetical protein
VKPIWQCRRRRACIWEGEPLGGGKGNGEGREGVQYTANQGPEWTGIRATTQWRDFQVSKGRVPRVKGRDFQAIKKGLSERGLGHAPLCIYCANKRLSLGYK